MRAVYALLVFAASLQAGASLGTVLVESSLRGAPRSDAPEAGTLAKGASVIVHHEEGDWLALQAPRGSVSWISHLFLEFPDKTPNAGFPKNAVVRSEGEVKLALGKPGVPKPLDVRKTAVPDGTIVLVIGPAVKSETDRSTWYPVVPPEDDFRYVPRSAVQLSSHSAGGFVVKSPQNTSPPPPVAAIAGPVPVPLKASGSGHPLWTQAEQAEQTGDLDKAERLYFQLAREMNAPGGDGDLANLCYTRVHSIRERRRGAAEKGSGFRSAAPMQDSNLKTAAWSGEAETTPRVKEETRINPETNAKGQWTGSGFLRLAGFKVGPRQAYALEDPKGRLMAYAVPVDKFELDKYRNKTVDLFGAMSSPKDLRGVSLVEVSKVDQVR